MFDDCIIIPFLAFVNTEKEQMFDFSFGIFFAQARSKKFWLSAKKILQQTRLFFLFFGILEIDITQKGGAAKVSLLSPRKK